MGGMEVSSTLTRGVGKTAEKAYTKRVGSDLIKASPFPRKPLESIFEFLLILVTPALPPKQEVGEQDFRTLYLAERELSQLCS